MCNEIILGEVGECWNVCGSAECPAIQMGQLVRTLVADIVNGSHGPLSSDDISVLMEEGGLRACEVYNLRVTGVIAQWELCKGGNARDMSDEK